MAYFLLGKLVRTKLSTHQMLMKRILFIAMLGGIGFTTVQCTKTIEERVEVIRERGNAILSGNGIPDASLGKVGDYYLDLSGVNLYGAKTAEGWGNPISLRGLKGDKGNDGQNGTDAPVPNIKGGYWYIGETNTGIKAEGKDGTNGSNGSNGTNGKDGKDGKDGVTPTITINSEGYWVINGQTSTTKAKAENGKDGKDGKDGVTPTITINSEGYWVINGQVSTTKAKAQNGKDGKDGKDGVTPTITINNEGYWVINGQTSTTKAKGEDGKEGKKGDKGADGAKGQDGKDAPKPNIKNGYWYIGDEKTEVKATGAQGEKGERGLPGKDGSVIYADKGKPTTQGKDGDYYIDTEAKIFYGPKANNTWPTTGISLTGKNINNEDYQLSDDGKTLIKWLNPKTRFIDMDADPRLREVTKIGNNAFDRQVNNIDYQFTTIIIGNKVNEIGENAFRLCNRLRTVELPEELRKINAGVFDNCTRLQNIEIPENVTSIGTGAFSSCVKLFSVIIPKNVTSLGNASFSNCANLHTIIIRQPNAFPLSNIFVGTPIKNIYVPSGSEEGYKSKAANLKDKIKVLDLVD